ncbi:MAG: permease [Opitutae bacterium]|nr:permease [Opitutae bacterium]
MTTKKNTLARKWKREYYKMIDGIVRSHSLQKFFVRSLYLICFIASVIFATLLYLNS